MIFIGVALLIAVGLAVVISADAGSLVGLTEDQTGQLIPLLLILIVVAGGAFGRRRNLSHFMTSIALWVGIFGVVLVGYTYREEVTGVATRVFGELSPGSAIVAEDGKSATFFRSFGGSFRLKTSVNGAETSMVFDTGATAVVLTHDDAILAGIDTDSLRYSVRVQTANGVGRAAPIVLANLRVGDIQRRNIRAFVAEEEALRTSLLGMTFLETLSGYAVSNDKLELRD